MAKWGDDYHSSVCGERRIVRALITLIAVIVVAVAARVLGVA